jgi:hypothetical protein
MWIVVKVTGFDKLHQSLIYVGPFASREEAVAWEREADARRTFEEEREFYWVHQLLSRPDDASL